MAFKTIIPATDWFYVHPSSRIGEGEIVHHLAAFALTENDTVVGLVPVGGQLNLGSRQPPQLVAVSPNISEACYLHRVQLDGIQLGAAKKR